MKRKIIMFLLLFLLFASYQASASIDNLKGAEHGDHIEVFGVNWIVLDEENGLLIYNEPNPSINQTPPFWKVRNVHPSHVATWEASALYADLINNFVSQALTFDHHDDVTMVESVNLMSRQDVLNYSSMHNGSVNFSAPFMHTRLRTFSAGDNTWAVQVGTAGNLFNDLRTGSTSGIRPIITLDPSLFSELSDVENLTATQTDTTVHLSWSNPSNNEFESIKVYRNDVEIATLTDREEEYNVTGLSPNTEYTFKVTTINSEDQESFGRTVTVLTDYGQFDEVTIRGVETYYNQIFLNWDNPTSEDFEHVKIYEDEDLIDEVEAPESSYWFENLKPDTSYRLVLTSYYDPPGYETDGIEVNTRTEAIPQVSAIHQDNDYHSVSVTFKNPFFDGFRDVALYQDNQRIAVTTEGHFHIEGLEHSQSYEFEIRTRTTDGYESEAQTISVQLQEPPKLEDITNVTVSSTHERVDLSWSNPQYNPYFDYVRIYRRDIEGESEGSAAVQKMSEFLFGSTVSANENEFDPLFETNGNYFNDLSVEHDSDYEYRLASVNDEGEESDGVYVTASTDHEPEPSMGGVDSEEQDNGDYLYTWTSPTTGTVRVIVGGDEFATVPASDGEILIPSDSMSYTLLGNPDVQLIPITENGTEGSAGGGGGGLGGINLPFTPNDVLLSAVSLFTGFSGFVILALVFFFTPTIMWLIKTAIHSYQVGKVHRSFSAGAYQFYGNVRYRYSKRYRDGY
ncbi:fibronectin type III domain-containing protein [Halalkalibacter hemicellulosilyticus]|uniref:Fibronectin type-III domain-containing protein n=1 Tax=Halalkalibacter hemicellulosilyticusJCM 9152 TaxID=1236971 RepID=W4QLV3_9BACI|nr:fibronectin type III domain-containing protein [Halalkalibacter hemicellulosilyticus]GAE32877.1 hypothetical protein JCM9152_4469 [Halalkalibacter hemicellulosilyticusJCM 9152]